MKLDITEEYFIELIAGKFYTLHIGNVAKEAIKVLKQRGVTFKQPIDWEAETHDPSLIPDNWFVEAWNDGYSFRRTGLLDEKNNYTYDNYRAIKKEDWPKWAIEAHKSLED